MNNTKNKINIIAHRGYWIYPEEKNTLISFNRAIEHGFGIETDVRDIKGTIVISHDMPSGNEITFETLLQNMVGKNLPLALNIKADGLGDELLQLLHKYHHTNYFTFDMSIPEMVVQHNIGLRIFTGLSDIVPQPVLLQEASGVWLDCFYSDWFGKTEIQRLINRGKHVCIVSPDLHQREYKSIWKEYKNINGIMLCTDYPNQAQEFFNEK